MAQALNMMMWRLKVTVRNQDQVNFETRFNLGDVSTFLIEQEGRNIHRYLRVNGRSVFLHGFFLQQTQDLQRTGFGITDHTCTIATRAGDM